MSIRRPPSAFPVTLLTGFLGAGKTTLLNRLLRDPALADALVLINEFGEIGLDHALIEGVAGDMLVMSSGCLCCTIRGDLVSTLEDVLRRRDNGRMTPFRRLVVETTGLADPAPILHTFMTHPYLALRFALDGIVTVVDAVNGEATLDAHGEAVKQAAVADRIVVTKTDLVTEPGRRDALMRRLRGLNPAAAILDAAQAPPAAADLLGLGPFAPDAKAPDVRRWLDAEAVSAAQDHHHHHDVNRHDADIRAVCLTHATPIEPAGFDMFVDLLRSAHAPHVLRVKGLVALADDPSRPLVVHGVQHVFHPPVRLAAWPDADHRTRMVFILRGLAPSFVEGLWRAFTGQPAVDIADAAGLTKSPLTPGHAGLLG